MRRLLAHRRQFAVFVAGGVLSALADIGLMQILIARGVHYTAAASAGFALGLLVNYAFHAKLTFRESGGGAWTMLRYMCVVAVNYALTLGCVALSVHLTGAALPGKLVSLPLVAVNGFLLSKFWIFR